MNSYILYSYVFEIQKYEPGRNQRKFEEMLFKYLMNKLYTFILKCGKFKPECKLRKQRKFEKMFFKYLMNNLYTYVLKCRKHEPGRKSEKERKSEKILL